MYCHVLTYHLAKITCMQQYNSTSSFFGWFAEQAAMLYLTYLWSTDACISLFALKMRLKTAQEKCVTAMAVTPGQSAGDKGHWHRNCGGYVPGVPAVITPINHLHLLFIAGHLKCMGHKAIAYLCKMVCLSLQTNLKNSLKNPKEQTHTTWYSRLVVVQ